MYHHQQQAPPAFNWKGGGQAPIKDYMSENYRKLKNIAAEGQRKRFEPLKAKFIPGVTKNDRYAHVQSKVGASLRGGGVGGGPQRSFSDELANRRMQQSQRFMNGGGDGGGGPHRSTSTPYPPEQQNGNGYGPSRRLSRSSVDLRSNSVQPGFVNQQQRQQIPLRRQGSISASANNFGSKQSIMTKSQPSEFSPDFQILQPNPPDESIYKWKFNEGAEPHQITRNGPLPTSNSSQNFYQPTPLPPSQSHRVEYLACDGICAEETIVDNPNAHHNPGSARSTSSRTSRGCNTEETRIFPETRLQEPYQFRGMTLPGRNESREDVRSMQSQQTYLPPGMGSSMVANGGGGGGGMSNGNGIPLMNGNGHNHNGLTTRQQANHQLRDDERHCYPFNGHGGSVVEQMMNLSVRDGGNNERVRNENRGGRAPGLCKPGNSNSSRDVGAGGDGLHAPGTVPKYLKQRQEEWRNDAAAKKEAEESSHVPTGYMLMSEDERIETLRQFRKNYEMLIAELNRVPITVDTIRVKSHKADLERQLTRLEEAMKTFSRPRVWVKTDD